MSHTSYALELTPERFFPDAFIRQGLALNSLSSTAAEFARFMWFTVGDGFWTERNQWALNDWRAHIGSVEVSFIVAYAHGEPIGSFELNVGHDGVKIEGFGIIESYRGDGFGHTLLTHAVERAFSYGRGRVWLETATDDHPAAMPLYKSQGFKIFKEKPLDAPVA